MTTLTPLVSAESDTAMARSDPPQSASRWQRRIGGLWRGSESDPRWARLSLYALLAATAALYLVNLSASGWANAFYSAAAQAGSVSWKAFFFGSSDAANAITVDKTPAALWFMSVSVRILGLSSFAILLPQALMGVASVGVLYATVKRVTSAGGGLLAGAILALTLVAALMFRFNNPDALMVLLLIAAAWALLRAVETGRTRWLLWLGAFIGFAFLAKMMQAFLVIPFFALAYLVAGPPKLLKRIWQTLAAGAAMIAGGWWVLIVQLWPAASRPYIGGSQTNSVWDLMFGYNGLERLSGDQVGSVGWRDQSSATKVISTEIGGQISWLLWAAVIGMVAALVITWRRPRTDLVRAAVIARGGWLVTTTAVFSLMKGINHAYYWIALAPAIAALTAIGGHLLWQCRNSKIALGVLAGTVALCGFWAAALLRRATDFLTWLPNLVQYGGIVVAVALVAVAGMGVWARASAIGLTVAVLLAGPTAFTVATIDAAHTGALPTSGLATAGGGMGGAPGGAGMPGGGFGSTTGGGTAGTGITGTGTTRGGRGGMGGGGMAGLLDTSAPSGDVTALLMASDTTWSAAVVGSDNAAGLQLASLRPVMAIGGFNGTDPSPTLAEFQQLVRSGSIRYFVDSGLATTGGTTTTTTDTAAEITAWVQANYQAQTVGGKTIYDLSAIG
ncbi:MAG: glycosyltransferase family 39 protein [Nakamurella sp.]